MAKNVFKKGDIIKGIKNNDYGITNEKMIKAEVIKLYEDSNMMDVKIIEHIDESKVGETFIVLNDNTNFAYYYVEFDKSFITDECRVTLDNGEQLIYFEDKDEFIDTKYGNDNCLADLSDINVFGYVNDYKIVKIEEPTYKTIYEQQEEPKEMTLKEVCDTLGYDVKIIKEEN